MMYHVIVVSGGSYNAVTSRTPEHVRADTDSGVFV